MAVATTRDEGNTARAGRERAAGPDSGSASRPRKALTIGAVAKILSQEFDDISISKIRYLEDQKLLSPRRTQGGYRLYSQTDVERLRAILRMQRDEFLPLRVIRQELATGDFTGSRRGSDAAATRRAGSVEAPVSMLTPEELLDQAGCRPEGLLRELQEFGIVQPDRRDGRSVYDETDLEIVRAAAELRGSASPVAICASSSARRTARRRCCSSSSARRCGRAARLAARRRSRTWRAWRRFAGT